MQVKEMHMQKLERMQVSKIKVWQDKLKELE